MQTEKITNFIEDIVLIDSIKRNKNYDKISKLHKYWSRKPWYLIEKSILEYSKEGDLVLDPFIGSGTVALESLLNKRKSVGYDLNPFACFLSTELVDNIDFDIEIYNTELHRIEEFMKKNILPLYHTLKNDKSQFNENSILLYWYSGTKHPEDHNCILTDEHFKVRIKSTIDSKILNKKFALNGNVPNNKFPKEFYKDRFSYKGYSKVSDFYSSRNLSALSSLHQHLKDSDYYYKNLFLIAFTNTVLHTSYLKGNNVRPLGVNNYWIPDDNIQENVVWRYLDRAKNVAIAKSTIKNRWIEKNKPNILKPEILNKSSLKLNEFKDNSVDYIITDPPYGDVIQYSELSFIWNSWMDLVYENKNEVIINPKQDKNSKDFLDSIKIFIDNSFRVLKNESKFTLCFQNKNIDIWYSILELIKESGFSLFDIKIYETVGSTYNQNWAKFSPKNDLYVTFIKKNNELNYSNLPIDYLTLIKEVKINLSELKKDSTAIIFDVFVCTVIDKLFNGYQISGLKGLTLKKLLMKFEEI
jgi:DNA modification methylase